VWFAIPENPRQAAQWQPNVFAERDAPGLTHYLGVGDVNGDGFLMRQQERREDLRRRHKASGLPGGSHPLIRPGLG